MGDENMVKKIIEYLSHKEIKLQTGALFVFKNLVNRSENLSSERNAKLVELGLLERLRELLNSTANEQQFYDDVRSIIRFLLGGDHF